MVLSFRARFLEENYCNVCVATCLHKRYRYDGFRKLFAILALRLWNSFSVAGFLFCFLVKNVGNNVFIRIWPQCHKIRRLDNWNSRNWTGNKTLQPTSLEPTLPLDEFYTTFGEKPWLKCVPFSSCRKSVKSCNNNPRPQMILLAKSSWGSWGWCGATAVAQALATYLWA